MGTPYEVQQGDCLSSIAEKFGFPDYRTIYQDGANADFRSKRANPNIIFPGDLLIIPDRHEKDVSCATDEHHRFVTRLPKVLLRLCLQDDLHEPYRSKRYRLKVGNDVREGNTDGDGMVEQRIPADATGGEITIFPVDDDPADPGYTFPLDLGHLDPIDETSGIDGRLVNLGFGPADQNGIELSEEDRAEAIRAFQQWFGVEVTGEADETTQEKLRLLHDGE
jgi:N-acetylmuramoyl-L-alanine amidase